MAKNKNKTIYGLQREVLNQITDGLPAKKHVGLEMSLLKKAYHAIKKTPEYVLYVLSNAEETLNLLDTYAINEQLRSQVLENITYRLLELEPYIAKEENKEYIQKYKEVGERAAEKSNLITIVSPERKINIFKEPKQKSALKTTRNK